MKMKINIKKVVLLLVVSLIMVGCNKKRNVDLNELKSLDELISFKLPSHYEKGGDYYLENSKIKVEEDYSSTKNDGYFQIEIFSFKNKDVYNDENNNIDEIEYIDALSHKRIIAIDNEKLYIGYRESEEMEDVYAKAYVRSGNYVFEFMMGNSDDPITKEQYEDFENILKTIKFK